MKGTLIRDYGQWQPKGTVLTTDPKPGPGEVFVDQQQFEAIRDAGYLPDEIEWSLKLSPEKYLERHPDGQHADLARQLTGAGVQEDDDADSDT